MIDVDSFVKFFFVLRVHENPEPQSSVYLYKDGTTSKLHAGPVWDFDLTSATSTPARIRRLPAVRVRQEPRRYRAGRRSMGDLSATGRS